MAAQRLDPLAFAANTTLFGIGGWALENALYGPRFSAWFGGARVPFLPIYAAGGATVLLVAPYLRRVPWILRGPLYAALLSGVEFVGCQIDRRLLNACSWDYVDESCATPLKGCVDVPHAIIWGVLGLLGEALIWLTSRDRRRHGHEGTLARLDSARRRRHSDRDRHRGLRPLQRLAVSPLTR